MLDSLTRFPNGIVGRELHRFHVPFACLGQVGIADDGIIDDDIAPRDKVDGFPPRAAFLPPPVLLPRPVLPRNDVRSVEQVGSGHALQRLAGGRHTSTLQISMARRKQSAACSACGRSELVWSWTSRGCWSS